MDPSRNRRLVHVINEMSRYESLLRSYYVVNAIVSYISFRKQETHRY